MKHFASIIAGLSIVAAGTSAQAQARLADRYANSSISLLSQSSLLALPSASGIFAGNNTTGFLGIGASVRFVVSHVLIQPEVAFSYVAAVGGAGSSGSATIGFGIGGAVAVSDRLALSPQLHTTFNIPFEGSLAFLALITAQLPLTIIVGQHGFIEPYVELGGALLQLRPILGTPQPVQGAFVVGVGYRLGVTF